MKLPIKQNSNKSFEKTEEIADIVDEEDVKMFLIDKHRKNKTQTYKMESNFYRPKQSIVEYMKNTNKNHLTKKKIK